MEKSFLQPFLKMDFGKGNNWHCHVPNSLFLYSYEQKVSDRTNNNYNAWSVWYFLLITVCIHSFLTKSLSILSNSTVITIISTISNSETGNQIMIINWNGTFKVFNQFMTLKTMSSLSFSIFQSQFMNHKASHKFDGPITWLFCPKLGVI